MNEKSFNIIPFITIYTIGHLAVDAACAFLLLGVLEYSDVIIAMLIYNSIAFVLQAPLGFLIDKAFKPKLAAILGLILVAFSFFLWNNIYGALIVVGIGNALYHVGGGSLVLSLNNKKGTFSGIFIAPGAIGLAVGTFLAKSQIEINQLFFPLILLLLSLIIIFVKIPTFYRSEIKSKINFSGVLIVALIMIPIAVRSLIGLSLDFPWKANQNLLILLVVAIALGKVFGGVLADKYGLVKVGVGGLLISTPFLAFYSTIPVLGIIGAFIFNFTMPVTLIAILNVIPNYKGLSFGLTTVALFIGSVPAILGNNEWVKNEWVVFGFILLASILLYAALKYKDKLKTFKI